MNDPRFGIFVALPSFATVRAMLLGPANSVSQGQQNWCAIVLRDEEEPAKDRWPVGRIITIAPEGDHIIEVADDE